ncbi:LysR family transcriptional regulator, partial [Pseudomonas aeruginosa]|nr:LysR family transcriptional regulator [Pseudomonas aeruginosa]
ERAEFGLFAAVDHPLAGLERVSERDLSEWRLLRLNTYSETGAAINDGLPSSGGRCWSAPNYLLLLEMATHGFGWAELPRWLVSGYANGRL